MASLTQRTNGYYYASFYDTGRRPERTRLSLKTKNKSAARRLLVKLEKDWRLGHFDPWTDDPHAYDKSTVEPKALKEALLLFLEAKRRAGRAKGTLRTYREVGNLLLKEAAPETSLMRLRPHQIRALVWTEGLAQATRHKRYGHLRTFFRWCIKERLLKDSPLGKVDKPRKPEKLPKAVTPDELTAICTALRKDYERKRKKNWVQKGEMIWRIPLFRFALYTGLRGSELGRLRWQDLDFERGLIYVWEQKNRKEETVPLSSKAREALEEVEGGRPRDFVFRSPHLEKQERSARCFRNRASRAFRKARRLAGIERKISFHGLRHGFCTLLAEAGKPAHVIKVAARHADISTSMRYVHMSNEYLKRELEDVFD